ncbi:uncharacterized protein LOC130635943 [Hydractinia symbiolongicarpus]|uniref:uncharacterized protein LOC130635943 n=1 Tax=Hydractinia symbiolongicarpus TaxID=13093 RepID=UPI00254F4080|nr:uncharacterized protein LOC130635943 [Hydractinia symbiolongicarpus]XP_057301461.1 uncharacterized protein LOC130635943 [Hydractinia symbiolongicarpus]
MLYVLPDYVMVIAGKHLPTVAAEGKSLFQDRLTATFNTAGKNEYIATLEGIQFKDNHTYRLIAFFDDTINIERKHGDIQIKKVVGKPMFCGKKLDQNYTIVEGESLNVRQDVCGHPKPVVDLKIGSRSISLSSSSSKSYATTQYNYTNVLIKRKDCGRHMVFTAENKLGRIKDNAVVGVLFTPSTVSVKYSYRDNNSCIWVSWDSENTGNCAVEYHLQFENIRDVYNTYKKDYIYCLTPNASNVTIWASYKGISGKKVIAEIQHVPPTTEVVIPEKIIVQGNVNFMYEHMTRCPVVMKLAL